MAKSSHLPKNASVFNPLIEEHCELFWQTANCDHVLENYYSKEPKIEIQKDKSTKIHDVKFRDFDSLLSGNTHWKPERNKIAIFNRKSTNGLVYKMIAVTAKRTDCKQLFLVVISCYICTNPAEVKDYEKFENNVRDSSFRFK